MSKNLSAKYYQENKDRLQKKSRERYQNLSKEGKEKMTIWSWTLQKSLGRWKKLVEYRKKINMEREKRFIKVIKKYFNLENFTSLQGKV